MLYEYVGYKTGGEMVKGTVEAESSDKAEESLWKSEVTIISLKKKKVRPSMQEMLPSLYAVKRQDVINFTRDLQTLLAAGIGIYPSLTMLYERSSKLSVKNLVRDVLLSVESGSSFSDACAKHPKVFSPFYLRMTRVGEEIGNLEQMLSQITVQMQKEAEIRKKVKGALTYPTIVLFIAVGAIAALITFVVPAMKGLFEQMGGELPFLTKVMVGLSDFVTANILYMFIAVVLLIGGAIWYFRTPRGKRTKDTIMLSIPLIKDVQIKGNIARTARNLSILLSGGVPITESLDLVIQTSDNVHFKEAFRSVRSEVGEGLLLSQALANHALFPKLFGQVIGVGELTGRLEPNLESVADFYEMETDNSVSRATSMLTPILTVGVGGLVAVIALSMYQPIYGIAGQLQTSGQ